MRRSMHKQRHQPSPHNQCCTKNKNTMNTTKIALRVAKRNNEAGFSLLEMALVIALVVGLLGILAYNFGPFKEAQNKVTCQANQEKVQQGLRSYQLINQLSDGATVAQADIIGSGKMISTAPVCKSGGTYTYGTTIPAVGTAWITCGYSSGAHNLAAADIQ